MFFLTLVIAGISSGISIIEALASAIRDKFPINRFRVITLLCFTGFVGSIFFCTRGGIHWLEILDNYVNNYGLVTEGASFSSISVRRSLRVLVSPVSAFSRMYWRFASLRPVW